MKLPHRKLIGANAAFVSRKNPTKLISPLCLFQRKQDYAGYSNIARNVPLFYAINDMLIAFDPSGLDEREGIENTGTKWS